MKSPELSGVVLNLSNRFLNNNRLKLFLTESGKPIFAMNVTLTNFLTTFCPLGFTFVGISSKFLKTQSDEWLGVQKKRRNS